MKRGMLISGAVFYLVLVALSAGAEPVVKEIYYQKKVSLGAGKTHDVKFSLWDAETGGNEVWSEEKTITLVSGYIQTYLGEVTPLTGVDFSQQLWVQVENKTKSGTFVVAGTRDMFGAVPYALYSESSGAVLNTDSWLHSDTNTFIGVGAAGAGGLTHSSGNDGSANTALGNNALYSNTTGYHNTASGADALTNNTTGYSNTATGMYALRFNSAGYENTATGRNALHSNTTGYQNTATGMYALYLNTTGYQNTASGMYALNSNTSGISNTASGVDALRNNTTGNQNTAFGGDAGFAITTGGGNTFLGTWANALAGNLTNTTAIGAGAVVDASNHIRIGDTSITQIGGQVAWSNLSDLRSKKDARDISQGLEFIKSLRPVEFRMKDGNGRKDFGFIAQEVEALLGTGYNVLGIGADPERMLSLRYTDFIAPMVKAMQEQQKVIEELRAEIAELKRMMGK